MSGNLGATLEDTSWVITSYAIANVIIIPLTSFLAAKLGRRNYYIGSIIAFAFFSFMCGQADNIWELVAFRFMQGLGGGALLSVSQSIVFDYFRKKTKYRQCAFWDRGFCWSYDRTNAGRFYTDIIHGQDFLHQCPLGISSHGLFTVVARTPKPNKLWVRWTGWEFIIGLGVSALQLFWNVANGRLVCHGIHCGFIGDRIFRITALYMVGIKNSFSCSQFKGIEKSKSQYCCCPDLISGIGLFSSVF